MNFPEAIFPEVSSQGHRVYASDLNVGRRRLGIIVNRDFKGYAGDFWQHGRAVCMGVSLEGLELRLVSAHLSPGPEAHQYICVISLIH